MDGPGEAPVGETTLAERQLTSARRDPRLDHGREAVVADWWAAIEAAERTRMVAVLGAHARRDMNAGATGALGERAQLAEAEINSEFAEENALVLVGMLSALDALVEGLVPAARELLLRARADEVMTRARHEVPEAVEQIAPDQLEKVQDTIMTVMREEMGKVRRASGAGAGRWEKVLGHAHLQAPVDRPVPEDLDEALRELVALRHVLVHRAGRVDEDAVVAAPSYEVGVLVRIGLADYRRYSAAVRTYGDEVVYRLLRGVDAEPFDLRRWRDNYMAGA